MSDSEFDRAMAYAMTALAMLKRASIPPYPQFYELWYTYASGISEQLNNRLNALMADGRIPTAEEVMDVYREFLSSSDLEHRLSTVSAEMTSKIDAVTRVMNDAMTSAHHYSGQLEAARENLQLDLDGEGLKALAASLLGETHRMQEANRKLEEKLETSKQDISVLQRDLDDARRESLIDALTRIANRKCFDDRLVQEIASAGEDSPLTLLLIDIDHFKRFNDTYGHQTGDQVLRLVAMTIRSNIKGRDLAARYGGEEFAAILPRTDLEGGESVAELIRMAVQAKELLKRSTREKLGRITVSVGVAQWRPGESAAKLIERADQCLYGAKRTGRNKVVIETDPERLRGEGMVA